jgi:peptide/nickel transport system substrate-binding protein
MGAGAVPATQVFAEQCKGAGVKAKVKKLAPGEMYGDNYQKRAWAQEEWSTHIYFSQVIQSHTPDAPYNTTKWHNDEWWALVSEAMRTLDATKRNELVGEAMKIQWENDGMLIWSFTNVKDGYSTKLGGLIENNFAKSATWFNFKSMYFV